MRLALHPQSGTHTGHSVLSPEYARTVDQFIRHAESGFFGGDEEADFVWDGDY